MYKKMLFFIAIILLIGIPVYALEENNYKLGYLTGDSVRVRSSTEILDDNILGELYVGNMVKVIDTNAGSTTSCNNWYKILYNEQEAYICGRYVRIKNIEAPTTTLDLSLFPSSYHESLTKLHEKYPTWALLPLETNLKWDDVIKEESNIGDSLIYYTYNEGYRSFESPSYNYLLDKFYYDPTEGKNWYYASKKTVAYYMDPRNFLDEKHVFMFEDLSYNPNFQNANTVNNVLGNTFMPGLYNGFPDILNEAPTYADAFIKASTLYDISPIHLASRVRQEMGINGSGSSSGAEFTYKDKTYSGLYNFYNIGAYGYKPTYVAGLIWANGGENGTLKSYNRPWTNPYLSIIGGAEYIASRFINKGQNTLYLERFNVKPIRDADRYTNQYMTNISAHVSEASTVYTSYRDLGLLDESFVFLIPIYKDMPSENASLPNKGNPNNYLKNIKINDQELENFSNDRTEYDFVVPEGVNEVNVTGDLINSKASLWGNGKITFTEKKTTIRLTVYAENGDYRFFIINFIKEDIDAPVDPGKEEEPEIIYKSINEILDNSSVKYNEKYISGIGIGTMPSGIENNIKKVEEKALVVFTDKDGNVFNERALRTGDKIKIVSGKEEKTFEFIIYGDVNGDGEITILDLLKVQKHLLGSINLEGVYLKASDVNKDNEITILDLLKVQKHLLGSIVIE